ncbi:MAG: methyltransferase domain-containing protein [gamma proteobacterium symbiont of Taylorina sp.]|nr:methyltransferase domain-containing protein [gamma proteobacterium symbiont of Taylorina sp.]
MFDEVKDYYGKILQSSTDLKTDACCTDTALPDYLKQAMAKIHAEVASRYYGCGLVRPQQLQGMRILDLGCGSGRDCYILSQMVGEDGFVLGVDMTDEQLEVANQYIDYHTDAFAYKKPNIAFKKGYIERLDELDLDDNSFDIIVSNCVINLSPDKESVLKEAYRVLKPGGELYFSDVYSDRRVPEELVKDPVLYGECLSGALYWNDFQNLAKQCGFLDPRLVEDRPLGIDNAQIEALIGHINFYSATYRLFKLDDLEPACEDYGQSVVYKGTIEHHKNHFTLDKYHTIEKGRHFSVCGNTWKMLYGSRFREHFEFFGHMKNHFGIFPGCGSTIPFSDSAQTGHSSDSSGGSCC